MAHLRVIFRQPAIALDGKKVIVLNDGVEVVENGEVLADLSSFVRRIEVLDEVASARIVRLELFAGEIAAETEPPREGRTT